MNRYVASASLLLVACGAAPPSGSPSSTSPTVTLTRSGGPDDGAILAQEPCPLPSEDAEIAASVLPHAHKGHDHGPPAMTPPGPPVEPASIAEIASLRASVAEGRCRRVRYRSSGLSVVGFVLEPRAPGRHPAIVVARGGNRELGRIGPRLLLEMNYLAERGFVVVATQYRGVDGGEGTDQFGGGDVDDLASLAPLARNLPTVEPGDPFVLGYSRGGMTGALALRRGLRARAVAFLSGSFDLLSLARDRPEMRENMKELVPGYEADPDRALRERSAVEWGAELKAPMLLLAGTRDWRCPPATNACRLHQVRTDAKLESRLVTWDDDHDLGHHRLETLDTIAAWFTSHAR